MGSIKDLEARITKLAEINRQLERRVDDLVSTMGRADRAVSEAHGEIRQLKDEVARLSTQVESLRGQVASGLKSPS